MFFGRIIATIVGFLLGGPIVAAIGFIIGWIFDRGFTRVQSPMDPEQRAIVERAFFTTVFPLLGRLAKCDGHVSQEEIDGTEQLMTRMGLSRDDRSRAIALFKEGTRADYDVVGTVKEFMQVCGAHNNLRQIFLVYLITIAYADGTLHPAEEELLLDVAKRLGYSRFAFNHLLGMIKAQSHFFRGKQQGGWGQDMGQSTSSADELALAYQALGVEAGITDPELKKAYRRLMSEYHPDKLAGRGVPEDMVKLATERSQEIQSAYELIKKSRQ